MTLNQKEATTTSSSFWDMMLEVSEINSTLRARTMDINWHHWVFLFFPWLGKIWFTGKGMSKGRKHTPRNTCHQSTIRRKCQTSSATDLAVCQLLPVTRMHLIPIFSGPPPQLLPPVSRDLNANNTCYSPIKGYYDNCLSPLFVLLQIIFCGF